MSERIRTKKTLNSSAGMVARPEYIGNRRPSTEAHLGAALPGHGGDVRFAKHNDGTFAVYCHDEYEVLDDVDNDVESGTVSKVRVMSRWWLVIDHSVPGTILYRSALGSIYSRTILGAMLFGEDVAAEKARDSESLSAVNAGEHIRSLGLPSASTRSVKGKQGEVQGHHEALGTARTMVDMLTGSPMAAALGAGG